MLTKSQKTTLRSHIVANGHASKPANEIADIYNTDASPAQLGWRESIEPEEIWEKTDLTVLIARSANEIAVYSLMIGGIPNNPTKAKIRKAVADIFSGSSGAATRADILTAMTENCSLAEYVLGGTSATTDVVTALKRNWVGTLSYDDVLEILSV